LAVGFTGIGLVLNFTFHKPFSSGKADGPQALHPTYFHRLVFIEGIVTSKKHFNSAT
jgi:hypothetical protein